jgi:hypothetical protein
MTTLLMSCDMPITHSGHIRPFDNSLLLRIRLYKEWQHCWRRQREQSVCLYIYFGSRNVCSVLSIYDPLESQKSFPLSRKPDCRTPPHLIYIDFIGVTGEEYPEARSPLSYTGGDNLTCINIYIYSLTVLRPAPVVGRWFPVANPAGRKYGGLPAAHQRDRPRSADVAFVESHG